MDDKDYVFARFKSDKPSADRRETLTIARRDSTPGGRSVEVVRVRSGLADKARRTDTQVRAASWEGSFPARKAAPAPSLATPIATKAPEPVAHYMPPLAPTLLAVEAETGAAQEEPLSGTDPP